MFGKLYKLAKEDGAAAFADGYGRHSCPFTDEHLQAGWYQGWDNANRAAIDAEELASYRRTAQAR